MEPDNTSHNFESFLNNLNEHDSMVRFHNTLIDKQSNIKT